jgi:hypothetical protein
VSEGREMIETTVGKRAKAEATGHSKTQVC